MLALDIIFLLNSANVALLLSTILDIYAEMGNQDSAGQWKSYGAVFCQTNFYMKQQNIKWLINLLLKKIVSKFVFDAYRRFVKLEENRVSTP